jgi:hypothetical protein
VTASQTAIRLANADGSLEIVLAGWQNPGATSGDGANCVNVDGTVRHPRGDWQFRAKFCRIGQLEALADWLEAVAGDATPDMMTVGGFMWHALLFVAFDSRPCSGYSDDPVYYPNQPGYLRVTFGSDTNPPWCSSDVASMDFPIAQSEILAGAAELRKQIQLHVAQ